MNFIEIGLLDSSLPRQQGNYNTGDTNSIAWDSFGEILDASLSERPDILESIKNEEWIYTSTYSFIDLSPEDFNWAVSRIRLYVNTLSLPTEWQSWGIALWREVIEPLLPRDSRYSK